MGTALLSLLSAVVGGLLVVMGDHLGRRMEDRRQWLRFAVESAATIVANKRFQRQLLRDARAEGRASLSGDELMQISAADRLADSQFFLAPVPENLRRGLRDLLTASNALRDALSHDDEQWTALMNSQKQAIYDFEAEVRRALGGKPDRARVLADGSTASFH